ncbi:MAG: flagellin [Bradymonadia bacterium]
MGFYLNTDSASLRATRSVGGHRRSLSRSFRQLSSGERNSHAGEDPTGVTLAARLGGHLKGLTRALDNALAGQEMARTAEGSLGEISDIVQRMRELAVQGANDTVSAIDRENINDEFQSLSAEITRIAGGAQYNSRNLLDGSVATLSFQVGAFAGERLAVQTRDARATNLGRQAVSTGAAVTLDALADGDLTINGAVVRATADSDDDLSTAFPAASAIAKAAAINEGTSNHGVTAVPLTTEFVGNAAIQPGRLDFDNALVINGQNIVVDLNEGRAGDTLVKAINAQLDGEVVAGLDVQGRLTLTASDGRNIQVEATGNAGNIVGVDALSTVTGQLYLHSDSDFVLGGANEAFIGFGDNQQVQVSLDEALSTLDLTSREGADKAILVLERVLEELSTDRARLGVVVNRLQALVDTMTGQMEQITEARSRINDTDFAKASADLARSQVLEQAGLGMLAQANSRRSEVLSLLQQ